MVFQACEPHPESLVGQDATGPRDVVQYLSMVAGEARVERRPDARARPADVVSNTQVDLRRLLVRLRGFGVPTKLSQRIGPREQTQRSHVCLRPETADLVGDFQRSLAVDVEQPFGLSLQFSGTLRRALHPLGHARRVYGLVRLAHLDVAVPYARFVHVQRGAGRSLTDGTIFESELRRVPRALDN